MGDRYAGSQDYAKALMYYEEEFKETRPGSDERAILEFKIALATYRLGNREKARDIAMGIAGIPEGYRCQLLGLRLSIFNDLRLYEDKGTGLGIVEELKAKGCKTETSDLERFYAAYDELYGAAAGVKGRFLIDAFLKRDTGDVWGYCEYSRRALREDPYDVRLLKNLISAFSMKSERARIEFDKNQMESYLSEDYPEFFMLLAEIYSRPTVQKHHFDTQTRQMLLDIARDFRRIKVQEPFQIFTSLEFQNIGTIVATLLAGEEALVFKIKPNDEKSPYVVITSKELKIGISGLISQGNFL